MIVTTGGRDFRSASESGAPSRPVSTSDSATRLTVWPKSSAISCAVSASSTTFAVTIWPCFINSLMRSTARMDMRAASSCTVMVSGMTTSRRTRSLPRCWRASFSRSRARLTEASERWRSSSSSALAMVSLPERRRGASFVLPAASRRSSPAPLRLVFKRPPSWASGLSGSGSAGASTSSRPFARASALAALRFLRSASSSSSAS